MSHLSYEKVTKNAMAIGAAIIAAGGLFGAFMVSNDFRLSPQLAIILSLASLVIWIILEALRHYKPWSSKNDQSVRVKGFGGILFCSFIGVLIWVWVPIIFPNFVPPDQKDKAHEIIIKSLEDIEAKQMSDSEISEILTKVLDAYLAKMEPADEDIEAKQVSSRKLSEILTKVLDVYGAKMEPADRIELEQLRIDIDRFSNLAPEDVKKEDVDEIANTIRNAQLAFGFPNSNLIIHGQITLPDQTSAQFSVREGTMLRANLSGGNANLAFSPILKGNMLNTLRWMPMKLLPDGKVDQEREIQASTMNGAIAEAMFLTDDGEYSIKVDKISVGKFAPQKPQQGMIAEGSSQNIFVQPNSLECCVGCKPCSDCDETIVCALAVELTVGDCLSGCNESPVQTALSN